MPAKIGDTLVIRKDAVAANTTILVPSGYAIEDIYLINNTANAITGGLRIGTSNGGAQVVADQAVAASAILHVPEAALLKKLFAKRVNALDVSQTLYVQAVTAWNSASINLRVVLRKIF